jgi:C1A family cysteine protease
MKFPKLFNLDWLLSLWPFRRKTVGSERKYGWIPDSPDHRDHLFKIRKPIELPPKTDLRDKLIPVFDQGSLGSCTGNAISSAYAFNMHKQVEDEIFVPSRLFIYYNEREIEGTIPYDSGARIRNGIKSINRTGVCDEFKWPYDISMFAVKPSPECYVQAQRNKAVKYERLKNSERELKTCLALGFPFVFGFKVYESFQTNAVAKNGMMPMPGKREKTVGGHAVTAVGYDDSTKCFIVKNSWGGNWGDKGFFYMPYDYITDSDLCADFWVIQRVS